MEAAAFWGMCRGCASFKVTAVPACPAFSWPRHLLSAFLGSLVTDSSLHPPLPSPSEGHPLLPGMKDLVPVWESQKVSRPTAGLGQVLVVAAFPTPGLPAGWLERSLPWGGSCQSQVQSMCNPQSGLSDLAHTVRNCPILSITLAEVWPGGTPLIPSTQGAEAGGSKAPGQSGIQCVETSLEDTVRPCL